MKSQMKFKMKNFTISLGVRPTAGTSGNCINALPGVLHLSLSLSFTLPLPKGNRTRWKKLFLVLEIKD